MSHSSLPPIICGPILRAVDEDSVVVWLVCRDDFPLTAELSVGLKHQEIESVRVGTHAVIKRLQLTPKQRLTHDQYIEYDIVIDEKGLSETASHLLYPTQNRPGFVFKKSIDRVFHGSCRRPHHTAPDGLVRVDAELEESLNKPSERPALLMHSGDQVYVDDVAGPMLSAIHNTIELLGLYEEAISGTNFNDSAELRSLDANYYGRDQLLPDTKMNEALTEKFFGGVKKPIFTSSNAKNHLISFSEYIGIYLLTWSPVLWQRLATEAPPSLTPEQLATYEQEQSALTKYCDTLPKAARAMANVPNYMIFDDHDITDDWNLSALWEITAYEHPFSRRIVGNALAGYLLCQGWGNTKDSLNALVSQFKAVSESNGHYNTTDLDALIDSLLSFDGWQYEIYREPMVVVLDTRTRRWRSEQARSKPSGLMDWEALSDFQQKILNQKSVIVVSPAPMFGVKLIETIQEIFTFLGKPLLVDAENWMAHPGSAEVMLNIFAHRGTPQNFTILSGDVHYSFAYDVRLKHQKPGPRIWQITSSGIKNQFPDSLLEWLDRLNRWLYAPYSPLNWFTKRKRFRVFPRLPSERDAGERLWNHSGIGLVEFGETGVPETIKQLNADQGECLFEATLKTRKQKNETASS
ncbi:alkaline phosphatase D family protein [Idiomarina sp. HP20-50]|uniref:alkaline phosphatase D family protein n=1 Tax=Idiomarina sp. HP20-50 TaxID=3070813 RepID=UPI00294B46D9|nr:alkaline phosphatase D family protein [Idiomarina sp. HP20-50]MDV6316409.1 alkaline phosphatase D family protein [Idiomarina sp. HP20-50]